MVRWAIPAWILAEVAAFVLVGGWVGVWATLGLVALSGIMGVALLRQGGARTLLAARQAAGGSPAGVRSGMGQRFGAGWGLETGILRNGEHDLAKSLTDGGLKVAAGLLLLLPGFLSDIVAGTLLIAPIRRAILRVLSRRMVARRPGPVAGRSHRERAAPDAGARGLASPGSIVEAEWEDVAPGRPSKGASGWTRP